LTESGRGHGPRRRRRRRRPLHTKMATHGST
jgi:hypothetical protein